MSNREEHQGNQTRNEWVVAVALGFIILLGLTGLILGIAGMKEEPASGVFVAGLGLFCLLFFPAVAFSSRARDSAAKAEEVINKTLERAAAGVLIIGAVLLMGWLIVAGVNYLITAPVG